MLLAVGTHGVVVSLLEVVVDVPFFTIITKLPGLIEVGWSGSRHVVGSPLFKSQVCLVHDLGRNLYIPINIIRARWMHMMPVEVVFSSWQLGNINSGRLTSQETWPQLKEEKALCAVSGNGVIFLVPVWPTVRRFRQAFTWSTYRQTRLPWCLVSSFVDSLQPSASTLYATLAGVSVASNGSDSVFIFFMTNISRYEGKWTSIFHFHFMASLILQDASSNIWVRSFTGVNCDNFVPWYHYITGSVDQQDGQRSGKSMATGKGSKTTSARKLLVLTLTRPR